MSGRRDERDDSAAGGADSLLAPVAATWARLAGIVLLLAAVVLTLLLAYGAIELALHPAAGERPTSSTLLFALVLVVLGGFCWQAGWRLVRRRPDRPVALFSWPTWLALGTVFIVMAGLMALAIFTARRPTLFDLQVILTLGAIGAWCVVLARRG